MWCAVAAQDYDVVLVGDFRFPGGTSSAMATEIDALAGAGYRVGLLPVAADLLSKTRGFNARIAEAIAVGKAALIAPGIRASARLMCLHHPMVFERYPADPIEVRAEQTIMVVHHPPFDANGAPQFNIERVRRVLADVVPGPIVWAPVGPQVRSSLRALRHPPPLTSHDWPNVVDPAQFGGKRHGFLSAVPVIGRHSRPEAEKWPDTRDAMLQAYPDAPDIRVRLMGFARSSVPDFGAVPEGWDLLDFGAMRARDFLQTIDVFSYFHSSAWIEAFGISIVEAMASGAVCLLPKHFEPLFGTGAVYCNPEDVAGIVRGLAVEPARYAQLSARGVDVVTERFAPHIAVARVEQLIGPPAKRPAAPAIAKGDRPRILYFTSNGIGMGHITRVMAIARRHREVAEPVIVSMSAAYAVAREEGMMVEHIPFFRTSGLDEARWHGYLRAELLEMFRFYNPRVVALDGNVPYRGLMDALAETPSARPVWLRRAMWVPGSGKNFLDQQGKFDAVVEPGELAGAFDRGPTVPRRAGARVTDPIRFLRPEEALERRAALAVLGLDPKRPVVALQLGGGNNLSLGKTRDMLIDKLSRDVHGAPQIVVCDWAISKAPAEERPGVTVLRSYPFARFLNAFDYAVALAGYNTFHENLAAHLPTLFLANEHPEQDEQWLRADWARIRGVALSARLANPYEILEGVRRLSEPQTQKILRAACASLPSANGADDIAAYLSDMAHLRWPHAALKWS